MYGRRIKEGEPKRKKAQPKDTESAVPHDELLILFYREPTVENDKAALLEVIQRASSEVTIKDWYLPAEIFDEDIVDAIDYKLRENESVRFTIHVGSVIISKAGQEEHPFIEYALKYPIPPHKFLRFHMFRNMIHPILEYALTEQVAFVQGYDIHHVDGKAKKYFEVGRGKYMWEAHQINVPKGLLKELEENAQDSSGNILTQDIKAEFSVPFIVSIEGDKIFPYFGFTSPDIEPRVYSDIACSMLDKDKPNHALQLLEAALRLDNSNPRILNNTGFTHILLGNFDAAMTHLEKALEVHPTQSGAHNNLGECYLARGQPEKAKGLMLQEMQLHPDNSRVKGNLEMLCRS